MGNLKALNEPMDIVSLSRNKLDLVKDSLSIQEIQVLIGAFESRDSMLHFLLHYLSKALLQLLSNTSLTFIHSGLCLGSGSPQDIILATGHLTAKTDTKPQAAIHGWQWETSLQCQKVD